MKKYLASMSAFLLLGLFGCIYSALPASAAGGTDYELCNSGNSESALRAYNVYNGQVRYVVEGSAYCKIVSDYNLGSRVDPDYEAINGTDIDRYRVRRADNPTYGYWHSGEAVFDPPDSWQAYGWWMQTDAL